MRPVYIKYKIRNLININKIVTIHYFEFDKNFHSIGESHDFWEFVYVDRGSAIATAGQKEERLKQGEYIFHKPNEFHTLSADGKVAPNIFIISFVSTSKAMNFFRNKKGMLPENLKHYVASIIEEGKLTFELPFNNPYLRELKLKENAPVGGQQIIKTCLEQLLIMLVRTGESGIEIKIFPSKESAENHLVTAIIDLLDKNIYNKISVSEICYTLNYSRAYLSAIFNKSCGYTIAEYGNLLKIAEAKKLIRERTYNFTQISDMLSFNNPHYFSRVFRRITGMSPSEYTESVKVD